MVKLQLAKEEISARQRCNQYLFRTFSALLLFANSFTNFNVRCLTPWGGLPLIGVTPCDLVSPRNVCRNFERQFVS